MQLPKAQPHMVHGCRITAAAAVVGLVLGGAGPLGAQIDPANRELIQLGYNQPLQGRSPISGYAFYYRNTPHLFQQTNLTLRLAVAPVYLDSELGIANALGPNTDLGLGLAGGGFADSYSEIREGNYRQRESFIGHGGEFSTSVYHLFNPGARIPLYLVLRGAAHYSTFAESDKTDANFELPDDLGIFRARGGLRWGGREPLMLTDLAMEISGWYEAEFRSTSMRYGFNNDRRVRGDSHLIWGRAMLAYTLPECKHNFGVSLTAGLSIHPDRLSTYRMGGALPLIAEFPLTVPGYYFQELSPRSFVLLAGSYSIPIDSKQRWSIGFTGAAAGVEYVEGLSQPGHFHSGVGAGLIYRSPSDSVQVVLGYGYGVEAIRDDERGAHSLGILVQFDLGRTRASVLDPGDNPNRSRGLQRFFEIFR